MNFISIEDDKGNKYMINLDNVIIITPYEDSKTSFHCVDDFRACLPISMDKVEQVIDNMTHKNHRVRVDGINLKGERLDVKVVNR